MLRLAASLVLCALLSGCQNPWKDFYQGNQLPEEAPANGAPECINTSNFDATIQEYARNGYIPFGQSSFNGGNNVTLSQLQAFGESIKADVILYASGNQTTTQSSMVLPQYNPGSQQTTYLSGYGSNGTSFHGTANTYSSGTYSSTVVPVAIIRRDYLAVYLKKNWNKTVLGILRSPVTPEQAKQVGSNSALHVDVVLRRSPAFEADVYEGDIILEANGRKIPVTEDEFGEFLERNKGKLVEFLIYRNGARITKKIQLAR
jgi:hypothetical protein